MLATFLRFNFGCFQLLVAFLFSVCRQNCVFPLKFKKKKTKKFSTFCFPQSDSHLLVFRISLSDSELALRRHAS